MAIHQRFHQSHLQEFKGVSGQSVFGGARIALAELRIMEGSHKIDNYSKGSRI